MLMHGLWKVEGPGDMVVNKRKRVGGIPQEENVYSGEAPHSPAWAPVSESEAVRAE